MRQPIKKLQKTTGLVGRLFVLFTSSCDPILLSLGAASHAVGVLWNDAATGRNSCFTRVTWVRRTKQVNMFRSVWWARDLKPPNPLTPFLYLSLGELFTFTNALLCLHSPLVFLSVAPTQLSQTPNPPLMANFGQVSIFFISIDGKEK